MFTAHTLTSQYRNFIFFHSSGCMAMDHFFAHSSNSTVHSLYSYLLTKILREMAPFQPVYPTHLEIIGLSRLEVLIASLP